MSFASEMAAMANELLAEFGKPRKIYLVTETPTGTDSAPSDPIRNAYQVNAVVKLKYLDSVEGGTLIDDTRRQVVMSVIMANGKPLTATPISGQDKMRFDNYLWTIDSVGPVSPGGEIILYKLEVKK